MNIMMSTHVRIDTKNSNTNHTFYHFRFFVMHTFLTSFSSILFSLLFLYFWIDFVRCQFFHLSSKANIISDISWFTFLLLAFFTFFSYSLLVLHVQVQQVTWVINVYTD